MEESKEERGDALLNARRFLTLFAVAMLFFSTSAVLEANAIAVTYPQEVSTGQFYRVRLEVSTTSDWTNVRLVSGAELCGTRLEILEGQNAPQLAYSSDVANNFLLFVGKMQYDQTLVKIQVTFVLSELEATENLVIEVQKGALGETALNIYNFNGNTPSLTGAFTDSLSGIGKNAAQFLTVGSDLMTGGPVGKSPTNLGKLVWAFYYPWYSQIGWQYTSPPPPNSTEPQPSVTKEIDKPLIGSYDSSSPEVIEKHIRMAKSAGIDGFIVSWWGKDTPLHLWEDSNLKTILGVASRNDFKIAIYMESWLSNQPRTEGQLEQMFRDFFQTYERDTRYFMLDGMPVIFIYWVPSQPVTVWQDIIQKMKIEGHKAFYIADVDLSVSLDFQYLNVFDGFHMYAPLGTNYDQLYRSGSLAARTRGLLYPDLNLSAALWAATITPGADLRETQGGGPYYPRNNGEVYSSTFRAAMASSPDWILISSFNEWYENTHIEPGQTYGWRYIDLTTGYSTQFKGVSYLPSLQISKTATVKGQQGNLTVAIVNSGSGSAIGVTAKDYLPSGTANTESVDRLLPGEEAHYSMPFDISSGQVSLQLPPGEIAYRDAYAGSYHVQTRPIFEYHLAVVSLYGSPMGGGWYEANGIASLSVSPAAVSMSGVLGLLGAKYVFDGWTGDLTSNSANVTIVMDGPKTVTAIWRTDYTQVYAIIGILILIALALSAGALIKKRRPVRVANKPETAVKTEKETQFCMNCGAKLPPESNFCHECGSAQSVHLEL